MNLFNKKLLIVLFVFFVIQIGLVGLWRYQYQPIKMTATPRVLSQAVNYPSQLVETNQTVSWLFFGDAMLDRYVGDIIKTRGFNFLVDKIASQGKIFFMNSDIVSVNLEGAVTKTGAHYPPELTNDFAWSPEILAQLKAYGFNYLAIANNHITDQGIKGYQETIDNLKNKGLNFSGAPDQQINDNSVAIMEVNGAKIGMISLSMVYGDFDLGKAKNLIMETKTKAEVVVVNIHWGKEYQKQFNEKQQTMAHALIDAGADLIIGHHPHVVQGMEVYKNKAIFYSLGNFIFDQYFSQDTQLGLSLGVIYESGKWQFSLFPLGSKQSQPYLLSGLAKDKFLKDLVSVSSLTSEFSQSVLKGNFSLK